MKCLNLFSGKNKKNISKCLLKFLSRVLRFKATFYSVYKCEKASWLKGLASKNTNLKSDKLLGQGKTYTSQPLFNTIVGVQSINCVR